MGSMVCTIKLGILNRTSQICLNRANLCCHRRDPRSVLTVRVNFLHDAYFLLTLCISTSRKSQSSLLIFGTYNAGVENYLLCC